ncbi:hypothetical protein PHET_02550 [Paragonimus heterotremus]|uniref:Uncharacterized protein n=1 Tax=Paragonimus heterotremus TaxID=100268 RepID=A0A8J4SRZ9_9TREM|nr:hypothetical protein PHET_02550 [Paragonimus heterotremus]
MSQQPEDHYAPELSQYSTAGSASAHSPVGQLRRDRQLEVGLARPRIQEVEKRIELERMIQQPTKLDRDEYKRKPLGDLNNSPIETLAFIRATERQIDLPRREIQRFADNHKSYWSLNKAFNSGAENRTSDNQARLNYLIQCCDGPAKASTEHCTILEEDRDNLVARKILLVQNQVMINVHTDESLDGPRLTGNDYVEVVQLAQQMTVCDDALRTIETTVRQLTPELHFRWADEAAFIPRSYRQPQFTDLTRFVGERADSVSLGYAVTKLGMHGSQWQLKLCTLNEETILELVAVQFDVAPVDSMTAIHIGQAWSVKTLPRLRIFCPNAQQLVSWPHLRVILFGPYSSSNVGVLVECDVPQARWVIDRRKGKRHEQYAIKVVLGWMLLDPGGRSLKTRTAANSVGTDALQDNSERLC